MTDRLTPTWAELAEVFEKGGFPFAAKALRDEAARREAEADAPPPPAPRPHLDKGPGYTHSDPAETCCNPPPAPDEYARLKADLADICVQWPGLNSPRQAIAAIEALCAERDKAMTARPNGEPPK